MLRRMKKKCWTEVTDPKLKEDLKCCIHHFTRGKVFDGTIEFTELTLNKILDDCKVNFYTIKTVLDYFGRVYFIGYSDNAEKLVAVEVFYDKVTMYILRDDVFIGGVTGKLFRKCGLFRTNVTQFFNGSTVLYFRKWRG